MKVSPSTRICSHGLAELRIDELGQEGEEEERRLRVEHVDDDAFARSRDGCRRGGRCGSVSVGVGARRAASGCRSRSGRRAPSDLHDRERGRRRASIAERPTAAAATCTSVPTWIPSTEASPAAPPWCDAARDDVEHGRPGNDEERERGEREDGERLRLGHQRSGPRRGGGRRGSGAGRRPRSCSSAARRAPTRPPVATTRARRPSSPRIAATIPSTWPAKP